jgi:ferredoxin-NADP reductase
MQAISSHPFTICSSPSSNPDEQSEIVFYIRRHGGFTARLHAYALEHRGHSVPVIVDGPYGGIQLQKYRDVDHVLVIAGGSGGGWCLPLIEQFVRRSGRWQATESKNVSPVESQHEFRSSGPVSLRVVLATRDTANRAWFLKAVDELRAKYPSTNSLIDIQIQVYLTGEAASEAHLSNKVSDEMSTPNEKNSLQDKISSADADDLDTATGREFEGRPKLPLIVIEEASKVRGGDQSLSVFVCGPTTMQNDVRNAVAAENLDIVKGSKSGGVYLHSEHFSWA